MKFKEKPKPFLTPNELQDEVWRLHRTVKYKKSQNETLTDGELKSIENLLTNLNKLNTTKQYFLKVSTPRDFNDFVGEKRAVEMSIIFFGCLFLFLFIVILSVNNEIEIALPLIAMFAGYLFILLGCILLATRKYHGVYQERNQLMEDMLLVIETAFHAQVAPKKEVNTEKLVDKPTQQELVTKWKLDEELKIKKRNK